jgi:hypothetical protein
MAGPEGQRPHVERTPQQPRQPDQTQPLQGRATGRESLQGPTTVDGFEPPQFQQESQERQKRTYIIYNPKKETLEEFRKRYEQAQAERREKRREYQRGYMKRYREKNKEAASLEQKPPEAIQIFPSVTKP